MRYLTRIVASLTLLSVAIVAAYRSPAPAAGQFANSPKITLRLSSAAPPGMEDSLALADTAKYLAKITDGTVTLDTYFSSSLFGEIPGMQAVTSGAVDMAIACTCNM